MSSREFSNIIIVRTDRIGDVVLTTPSIQVLKKAYPQSKISILVAPQTKDLVSNNDNIDEVIVDDRKGVNKGILGFFKLISLLRRRKFDLAIVYHTKKRTNLACFLAGIPFRIGYKNKKFGELLTHPLKDVRHLGLKHESEFCIDVVKALVGKDDLKVTSNAEMFVSLNQGSEKWATEFLEMNRIKAKDKVLAVHPGASDPSKQWPYNYFAGLINDVASKYKCRVLLVGDKSLEETSGKIMSLVKGDVVNATGLTTVSQLVSLLKRCTLLVSNDSGPVHIAAGLGVSVVSIFTRNEPGINPECWRPLSLNSAVVCVPPNSAVNMGVDFQKSHECDPKYLEIVKIPQVLEAVDSLFKL